jgi:hypothetical protein
MFDFIQDLSGMPIDIPLLLRRISANVREDIFQILIAKVIDVIDACSYEDIESYSIFIYGFDISNIVLHFNPDVEYAIPFILRKGLIEGYHILTVEDYPLLVGFEWLHTRVLRLFEGKDI